jgi:hypothetical protein
MPAVRLAGISVGHAAEDDDVALGVTRDVGRQASIGQRRVHCILKDSPGQLGRWSA